MAIREEIQLVGVDKTKRAFGSVQKSLGRLENNTGRVAGAFSRLQTVILGAVAAVGAFKVGKGFLDTAVQVENLGIQLKFLTGSAEEGAKAFDMLTDFAAGVPFELQQIANAAPNLLTVVDSTDELNELLSITGDIAAATGLDFKTTAEQLQRAFSGGIAAADLFREKGVKALLGFEEGARYTGAQTKKHIVDAFRDGTAVMKGASKDMADTFTGTMSMLSDKLFKFQDHLMASGPFEFIKAMLDSLNRFIENRFGSIELAAEAMGASIVTGFQAATIGLARFADFMSPVVRMAGQSIKGLVDMTNSLPGTIKAVGLIGFLMLGIKGKLVVLAIGAVFNKVRLMFADVMDQMAKGKEKIAGLMDALGFDEYAKSLRTNAAEIKAANQNIRDEIEGVKNAVVENNDDIIISMGKFGSITEEELGKAGPLTKKLIEIYKQLNEEQKKALEIRMLLEYEDPIIAQANMIKKQVEANRKKNEEIMADNMKANKLMLLKQKTFQQLVTDAEKKEAKKQLFIATQLHKKKMEMQQTIAEAEKAFREEQTTMLQAYSDGFKEQMNQQKTVFEQLHDAGKNAFNSLTDSLTDFVMTGKFKFKDFANMVIRELVRIAVQAAITFAMKKIAGSFFGIPFLAEGGPAEANRPYIVGERGPELFVPKQSGEVIPNNEMSRSGSNIGGRKDITINFTVNAIDANSFQDALGEQRDTIVNIVNEAVMDGGRKAIA